MVGDCDRAYSDGAGGGLVMVTRTNSHRGLRDWLIQRVTAVVTGLYLIFILAYLFSQQPIDYLQWHTFFHFTAVKIFTFIVLLSIVWHAWIGLWTVFTDYVKCNVLRLILEWAVLLLLFAYLAWGFEILWTT